VVTGGPHITCIGYCSSLQLAVAQLQMDSNGIDSKELYSAVLLRWCAPLWAACASDKVTSSAHRQDYTKIYIDMQAHTLCHSARNYEISYPQELNVQHY